jgi:amidohydrolase
MTLHQDVIEAVEEQRESLLRLSHFVHANPELGYEEHLTSAATAQLIEDNGFTLERSIAGLSTAWRATRGTGSLRIAICAEFDALPEIGHACGHNIIAASSVGAALALGKIADDIDVTVVLLGTPSEEGGGGKIDLINAGYFNDVHAAMMVHPWPNERLEATCLAVDHFDVIFRGKDAHASAAPWQGVNALDAVTIAQVAIGLLRQQLPPGDQVHGIVIDGGAAANIIPSYVRARFMCRSITADRLAALRVRVNQCFEAGSLATGALLEIDELGHQFSHMVSDQELLQHYRKAAEDLGRSFERDDRGDARPTISTDMANVSLIVPSIHPLIAIETHGAVNHQPEFTAACRSASADAAVLDGATALAHAALAAASDPALRERLIAGRTS